MFTDQSVNEAIQSLGVELLQPCYISLAILSSRTPRAHGEHLCVARIAAKNGGSNDLFWVAYRPSVGGGVTYFDSARSNVS